MKKLFASIALSFLLLGSAAHAEDWSKNRHLKKAAIVAVAMVVCGMDTPQNKTLMLGYMALALEETGMPVDIAGTITKFNADEMMRYIKDNHMVASFCLNALAANW